MNSAFKFCALFFFGLLLSSGAAFGQSEAGLRFYAAGDSSFEAGNYTESFDRFIQAASCFKEIDPQRFLDCRIRSAECLARQGDLKGALSLNQDNLLLCASDKPLQKAAVLNGNGLIRLQEGRYDLAEQALLEALSLYRFSKTPLPTLSADIQNNLGLCYLFNGNTEVALGYLNEALNERMSLHGKEHASVAGSYTNLGLAWQENDLNKALEYYTLSLGIFEKVYPAKHPTLASAYMNLGLAYRNQEVYNTALLNMQKAKQIWEEGLGPQHPNVGFALLGIAGVQEDKNDYEAARTQYEAALEVYLSAYGQKHPEVSGVYAALANLELQQGQYTKALDHVKEAYAANHDTYSTEESSLYPDFRKAISKDRQLTVMLVHTRLLQNRHFEKSLKMQDLKNALALCEGSDSLVSELRKIKTNKKDKLRLGQQAAEIYEMGLNLCISISEVSSIPDYYRRKAFLFAEKNKGAVLLEAISETKAKSFAGIPDSLIQKELNLKSEIGFLEQKLAQFAGTDKESSIRVALLHLQEEYSQLVHAFEKQYPEYFRLKYQTAVVSVSELQSNLTAEEVLLSYFISETNQRLYVFSISQKKYAVYTHELDITTFYKQLAGFQNSIVFQALDPYLKYAQALSSVLIPKMALKAKRLVFIPDGKLGLTPFEALLTATPDKEKSLSWQDLPYLCKSHSTRYAFSATLWAADKSTFSYTNGIALLAPIQFKGMSKLEGSRKEVQEIDALFAQAGKNHLLLLEKEANEAAMRSEQLAMYSIIHLATHGIVDMEQPELSRIYLYPNADPEQQILYASEIYGLSLRAKLVVLSACQTGLGKVSKGEGVIGLSRALRFAGAENIIVSYWSVNDESTKTLMVQFYQEILKGSTPEEALQKARLNAISDPNYAAPYYWAPFVFIGK
jgi:CHAT domain-containing protein